MNLSENIFFNNGPQERKEKGEKVSATGKKFCDFQRSFVQHTSQCIVFKTVENPGNSIVAD